jgi:hypothetical protein
MNAIGIIKSSLLSYKNDQNNNPFIMIMASDCRSGVNYVLLK